MLLFQYGIWRLGPSSFNWFRYLRVHYNRSFNDSDDSIEQPDPDVFHPPTVSDPTIFNLKKEYANIHLTPENPTHEGGSWHVEGKRVSFFIPYSLVDRIKPAAGHQKILSPLLVDPHLKILSTANVPCQQRDWWRNFLHVWIGFLSNYRTHCPFGLDEAKNLRLALIEERKAFAITQDRAFKGRELILSSAWGVYRNCGHDVDEFGTLKPYM